MCEITIKRDKIRIIIDEIFRIVIFNMYSTHNILHLGPRSSLNLYELNMYYNYNIVVMKIFKFIYLISLNDIFIRR